MKVAVLLATALACAAEAVRVDRVAIVGGGVGAASAAHHLRALLGDVEIDVFERSGALGGRACSAMVEGSIIELGASIAYEGNHYIAQLAESAGLRHAAGRGAEPSLAAIYDGRRLVFRESRWRLLTLLRLLWHYGFSLWAYRAQTAAMFQRFEGVYALQANGTAFRRPPDLLRALGLFDLTQRSMAQWIVDSVGAYDRFASEFVAGVNKVNYNQGNEQLTALVGLVSMLPATDPRVFAIQGGNQRLAGRVLHAANASVRLSAAVEEVARLRGGEYELRVRHVAGAGAGAGAMCTEDGGSGGGEGGAASGQLDLIPVSERRAAGAAGAPRRGGASSTLPGSGAPGDQGPQRRGPYQDQGPQRRGPYQAVILAAPLEGSGLQFTGVELPALPARKYQRTVTTLIVGEVRPSFFGLDPEAPMPFGTVLFSEAAAAVPLSSLSLVARTPRNASVYKLFSRAPVPHAWLEMLFRAGFRVAANASWAAYPRYDPPETFSPFQLAPGLLYNNAWESAASAMEMSAIAGRNSALLAAEAIRGGERRTPMRGPSSDAMLAAAA